MNRLNQIWNDIKTGENIELYLTVSIAIIVAILGLLNVANAELVSSLTLATLGLFAFSALQNRRKIDKLLNQSSGSGFSLLNDPLDLDERLNQATSIAHNGITLVGTSNKRLGIFAKCLSQADGDVQLLLVDPDSIALDVAAQRFAKHQDASLFRIETQHALSNFNPLYKKYESNFQIRLLPAMAPYSIWIIDRNTPYAEIWLGLYPFRADRQAEPWIKFFPHQDREMFDFLIEQFDVMWDTSRVPAQ